MASAPRTARGCGVLVFRRQPTQPKSFSFLLMKLKDRYDLPKGHQEAGTYCFLLIWRPFRPRSCRRTRP